ncbi:MAG: hypothetical protein E5X65_20810 [Mesorhizobium sp.]|nr:MAG: hypothetical protein E5X65_20810 [Mesorhizobium sp.]
MTMSFTSRSDRTIPDKVIVIDADALLPGDVILSTSTGHVSWLIRAATSSSVSHAALHIGCGVAIEANDPGVVQVFLPSLAHDDTTKLVVKRMPDLSMGQREELVQHAMELLYRPYSTSGAVGTVVPFLRKQSDPGRFCSQLVSHCYQMIERPICEKAAEVCTPGDIHQSSTMLSVNSATRKVGGLVHQAAVGPYAERYAKYLQVGAANEQNLIAKIRKELPVALSEDFYNIYDVMRYVKVEITDIDLRKRCDAKIAAAVGSFLNRFPLRPSPGIAVATFMFNPPPIPALDSLITDGVMAECQRLILSAGLAAKWELDRLTREFQKLTKEFAKNQSLSTLSVAAWVGQTVKVRMLYSRLCAASAQPGSVPRGEVEQIKRDLREMAIKDPEGAEEFSLDTFHLLSQEVARPGSWVE